MTKGETTPRDKRLIAGKSRQLTYLVEDALQASPWLQMSETESATAVVIDWDLAVSAWAAGRSEHPDPRIATCAAELLPQINLYLFATDAPRADYFLSDERSAGLTLASFRLPAPLMQLLNTWEDEVDHFAAVMTHEFTLGAGQARDPYRDGVVKKALTVAQAVGATVEFRQTLNLQFNLSHRLCTSAGDLAVFAPGGLRPLRGTRLAEAAAGGGSAATAKEAANGRHEVWRELQQLCQLRLDLIKTLSVTADQTAPSATEAEQNAVLSPHLQQLIASLAKRERNLYGLLATPPGATRASPLLLQQPGFALGLADGRALAFEMPASAASGNLPQPQEMLLTALRAAVPNPYHLTSRHASEDGLAASRTFALATEKLQTQLRRMETLEPLASYDAVAIDAVTAAAAASCESVLGWVLSQSPLLTLLLSGTLATYREAGRWGFCLSPWLSANLLASSVLKSSPLSYLAGGNRDGDHSSAVDVKALPVVDGPEAWTGESLWAAFSDPLQGST